MNRPDLSVGLVIMVGRVYFNLPLMYIQNS